MKFFEQSLITIFSSSFDCIFFTKIRIAIENLIRINQTLIEKF